MAEQNAKKSHQSDEDHKAHEDELVIKDSTRQDEEKPEAAAETPVGESSDKKVEVPAETEQEAAKSESNTPQEPKKHSFVWTRKKIIVAVVLALLVIGGVLAAVPVTRYAIAGVFIKRDFTVTLHDSKTNKPVTNVAVDIEGGASTTTDSKGVATFKSVPVGSKKLTIHKKYYKDFETEQTIGITGNNPSFDFNIEATGRQVPVKVINKISQKPIEGADVTADGTSSKTDKNGEATVVLPADKATMPAAITLGGYNKASVTVTITEQKDDKNTFAAVPAGKLYFLSKRSGTIDVLKSDLDGSNVETVLKGTGKEDERATVLLASRDWKYLALRATRDSDRPKLYLIDTASSKLTVMDEGEANFTPNGWYDNHFIYTVERTNVKDWEQKRYALKSYNASSGALTTLDESRAVGDASNYGGESITKVYLLSNNQIFYVKNWYGNLTSLTEDETVNLIQPDGGNKKVVSRLNMNKGNSSYTVARLYKPDEIYIAGSVDSKDAVWEFEDGALKQIDPASVDIGKIYGYNSYPTYLVSPNGEKTFWAEPRDGKNTLFVGDKNANNSKEVASLSEYTPYGWYGEGYLLVSKGGSELYIMSVSNPSNVIKVTDYHKPDTSFAGYGYGYGGL